MCQILDYAPVKFRIQQNELINKYNLLEQKYQNQIINLNKKINELESYKSNKEKLVEDKENLLAKHMISINMQLINYGFEAIDLSNTTTITLQKSFRPIQDIEAQQEEEELQEEGSAINQIDDDDDEHNSLISPIDISSSSLASNLYTPIATKQNLSPPVVKRIPWSNFKNGNITPNNPIESIISSSSSSSILKPQHANQSIIQTINKEEVLEEETKKGIAFISSSIPISLTSSYGKFSKSLPSITADYFDLTPSDKEFEVLYSWKSNTYLPAEKILQMEQSPAWNGTKQQVTDVTTLSFNKHKIHHLLQAADSLLVVYTIKNHNSIKSIRVTDFSIQYVDDPSFISLAIPSSIQLNTLNQNKLHYVFDVSTSLTNYQLIKAFKLEFNHEEDIEQIVILNYNRAFLHLAASPIITKSAVSLPSIELRNSLRRSSTSKKKSKKYSTKNCTIKKKINIYFIRF